VSSTQRNLRIGLALGSGSARGWAHIGILRELEALGIRPDIVCGTSIGALVGAAYVSGNLDDFEAWVGSLTRMQTVRFFEISRTFSGFVNTDRLHQFLNRHLCSDALRIEDCEQVYAAVATELHSGREVWLRDGSLLDAVWASISLPGLFPPIRKNQRWLVDGGLVNPVPVSVCRALDADIVIAVNLNDSVAGRYLEASDRGTGAADGDTDGQHDDERGLWDRARDYTRRLFQDQSNSPGLFDSIAASINIVHDRITRSRLAGDPADLVLTPRMADIALLEFHRAADGIAEGRRCVQRQREALVQLCQRGDAPA
jgi:NTE family protein